MKNKMGKIYISTAMIDKWAEDTAEMLSYMKFVPIRVECMVHMKAFEMIGLSQMFDELPDHQVVPTYKILCESEEGKFSKCTVEREVL